MCVLHFQCSGAWIWPHIILVGKELQRTAVKCVASALMQQGFPLQLIINAEKMYGLNRNEMTILFA